MHVIGTAGHVDHGKSTLIQALSGIDPDRLREEKERGMTIDLGFAWFNLPSGEAVGVVDVPGHADFIKNMLAGVGGIDAALLVVAADEGVMPQTREHLDILSLLEISTGVVALTKADLAESDEWLELVQFDIAETLAETPLADVPIIPVSATTGAGITDLLTTLNQVITRTPDRPDKGRPRLNVDRVFTISGFGTVVTGTLIDGQLTVGQEVEIVPTGLRSRIRGLQSHKQKVDTVGPGNRVAVNLTNVSKTDLNRGDVVTLPGWLEASQLIDTRLQVLPDTPKPLKHNQQVDVFTGAMEVAGFVRLLGDKELAPGETGWVQLRLAQRIPVAKGDRFIVRQPSPSLTIAGGVVVDPIPRRRHRRFRPDLLARLKLLAHGTPADLLLERLDSNLPVQIRHLPTLLSMAEPQLIDTLQTLLKQKQVIPLPTDTTVPPITNLKTAKTVIASVVGWRNLLENMRGILARYHQANPLRTGMPRGELMSRLKMDAARFNKAVEQAKAEGVVKTSATTIWLAEHQPVFSPAQQQAIDRLLGKFAAAPFSTPSYKQSLAALDNNEALLNELIDSEKLLRLSTDVLVLPVTFNEFAAWLREFCAVNKTVTVAQVRDRFNTSRKYALALLEYTDAQGITRRLGDERVLR